MRVLLLSWEYPPVIEGGLGRHVRKLSEELVAAGTEVHVLTRGGGALARHEVRHGVNVHRVREPPFPREMAAFLRWVEAMNADLAALATELSAGLAFDVVHSHDWLVASAAERMARALDCPWLVTVHATEYGRHRGWVEQHPQSAIHAAERRMVRRADHVITCSEFMRGHVRTVFRVRAAKLSAIPNGIDSAELDPGGVDLEALRLRFAGSQERLVLLVGRLVWEKGFHVALDALAPIMRRRRDVRFVVAGTGTAEAELKAQARRLRIMGRGTFLGWVGDDTLHALYRVADLCIVPSIYEPFGIVALEAMASGCLCVVADTGGLREVVPADGSVGLRFPVQDAVALRGIVEEMLSDESARADLVASAREHVLRFDWAEVTAQTAAVYRGLTAAAARV